jgi:hypothetical protein
MRRALLAFAAIAALALAFSACGGGGSESVTTVATDPEADVGILDEVLSRQTAAVGAYDHSLPALRGAALAGAREFRAQEQEHIDGTVQKIRDLNGATETEPEPIEVSGMKSQAEYLLFLYEMENATIEFELSALSKLTEPGPRSLLAATVANQAQHQVLLRRLLGAKPRELVPEAFENGTAAAP